MVSLANRSAFPEQIDSFVELYDLPPSLVASAKRYQELKIKPTLNATEQTELNNLTTELGNYIITPETWNKFADSLVNMETFIKDEIDGYLNGKQLEWANYVKDFNYVGVYSSSVQYEFQNMVKYNGDLYLCTSNAKGIVPTNTSNWQKISTKGDKGDVGLNTHLKGAYSATATYLVGDAVTYNGNVYYCLKNTTAGVDPSNSTYWFMYDRMFVSSEFPTTPQQGLLWIEVVE
jgi:hypothetical protein